MIKALIVDDECKAVNLLKGTIEKNHHGQFMIETAFSPEEGLEKIDHFKPDLLYLDVEMPSMTGFELLATLPEINFRVIFTTAYDRYAIQAIRYNALDYLLKPVNPGELEEAILRFQDRKHDNKEVYEKQLRNLTNNNDRSLAITTSDGVVFLELDKIVRCEADLNYTKFFLAGNKSFLSSKTLKDYEDLLTTHTNFIRVHRSHLLNVNYLLKLKNDGNLVLTDNSVIPISRRRKKEVMSRIGHA